MAMMILLRTLLKETLEYHHDKHHNTYVVNLNNLIKGTDLEGKTLEEIIKASAGDASKAGIFNNAAQVWNHTFYWNSMKPNGGGKPTGAIAAKIEEAFGSMKNLQKNLPLLQQLSSVQVGLGWLLMKSMVNYQLLKLQMQTLLAHGQIAVLTIDVWEHAYYIDFRNLRPKYIATFLESLVNWDYANAKLAGQPAGVENNFIS